jgi:hypothetical protein
MAPIKTYEISVRGFPPFNVSARTRGKAMAQAWGSYLAYNDRAKFKDFLRICRATRVPDPSHILKPVLVSGKPATTCIPAGGGPSGQYVHFMYDDGDTILCSHPSDVIAAPPPTTPAGG